MKSNKLKLFSASFLVILLFSFWGCQDENYELGELYTPINVDLTYEIVGKDAENPYGDGSGVVNFTTTAANEITFTYNFGDGTDVAVAPDGKTTHMFTKTGVNEYFVTVTAVGTGGVNSTQTKTVEVYSSFTDDEAVEFLTDGTSKTWYWAYDEPGHIGMGPNEADYGGADYTWPNWWQIGAYDTEKSCLYSSEFVFTKTANGLTFQQTTGTQWLTVDNAAELGITAAADACYGEDVISGMYDVKNVSLKPSTSKAALADIEKPYRGTAMLLSNGGAMGWWTGNSEYDIIEVTANTLKVRVIDVPGADGYVWYHTFTSEKPPVQ